MSRSLQSYTTKDLLVTSWKAKLEDAYHVMRNRGVRHLPVIDEDGSVIGILSDRDFARAMRISTPDLFADDSSQTSFDPSSLVRDFMSWPVESIDEKASIADAARAMIDKKISALIIGRDSQIVGIVTTEDLMRALLDMASGAEASQGSVKTKVQEMVYGSPIGDIAQRIADIGI